MLSSERRSSRSPATPRLPADLKRALAAVVDKKALDVVLLDLRKASAFTDFFLICTGANARQVKAIADGVDEVLRESGVRPALVEGYERAEWVLIDCFDFIVHIFLPATRAFYDLERLWGEARRLDIRE